MALFHPQQISRELFHFASKLFEMMRAPIPDEIHLFIEYHESLIGVNKDNETKIQEFDEHRLLGTVWISINDPKPPGILIARVSVFETTESLTEMQGFMVTVMFGDTIEKIIEEGKRRLNIEEVALWSIGSEGQMTRLQDLNIPLAEVIMKYPDLRIERCPVQNSQTFMLLDVDWNRVGPPFQFTLRRTEGTKKLRNRVRKYLNIKNQLAIVFQAENGDLTFPTMPYDDMPQGKFLVWVVTMME